MSINCDDAQRLLEYLLIEFYVTSCETFAHSPDSMNDFVLLFPLETAFNSLLFTHIFRNSRERKESENTKKAKSSKFSIPIIMHENIIIGFIKTRFYMKDS